MKIKDFIKKLEELNQESKIYYLEQDEDGEETCYSLSVLENQERDSDGKINSYYTIEKRN